MSFAFTHRKNVASQVCSIASEQIEKALGDISQPEDIGKTIHALRRRCKKLRGLISLVGPDLENADKENDAFRDAAASLSQARDAAVMVETLDNLLAFDRRSGEARINKGEAADITQALHERARAADRGDSDPFARFRIIFQAAKKRVEHWSLDGHGFDLVGDGLAKNYRLFRKRMERAEAAAEPEHLHDWRKVAKYHGHHIVLLRRCAPDLLKGREKTVDKLGSLLGDHHNLEVLRETLAGIGFKDAVADVINAQQAELANAAFGLGRQLAAEKPEALRRRFERYWALLPEKP
jgi:CHAD domain-containing protein